MKLIKPSVEFWGEVPIDYEGTLKWIERAGRVCYKSEDKICEGSAEKFVRKLVKAGHWAMLEHSNFVVELGSESTADDMDELTWMLVSNKFLNAYYSESGETYIGGNLRAWSVVSTPYHRTLWVYRPFVHSYNALFSSMVANTHHPLARSCSPNEIPKSLRRYTVKFTCDRGVSHEIVRHRPCSFAQESTRYVDYGGKDIEFIEPSGWGDWEEKSQDLFIACCKVIESDYKILRKDGLSPQQARAVLPNALKTELVVTADAAEWAHIKKLRTAPDAHPDMRHIMSMVPWEEIL